MKEQKSAPSNNVQLSSTSDAKPTQKKRSETPKSEENRSTSRDSDLLDSLYSSVNKSKDSSKKNHGIIEEDGDGDVEKSSVVPSPKTEPPRICAKPKTTDRAKQSDGPKIKHPNAKKRKQPNPNSDSPKSRSPSGKVILCDTFRFHVYNPC